MMNAKQTKHFDAWVAKLDMLKRYQEWRRGTDPRTMAEVGMTPHDVTAIIDWAIRELEGAR
jgi:hypothetical protein